MAKNQILSAVVEIAGSISPELGKTVESACKTLDKINLKAVAVTAAIATGAVAAVKGVYKAGKELVNLGSEFDSAYDAIRVGTGATGEALDALKDDFKEVYSSVPTSMEDASKAVADYNTRLGLTGDQLQTLSKQAIQVSDLLDEDLNSVIENSSKSFKQWNIDEENMSAAMDHVFKVSQATGVGFSDLMGKMQSYGAQLQELGYYYEEATVFIAQLEKEGVNADEALAAMKKSVTALANEGIDASDGLQMYIDAIVNAKDMTQATAIAAELFGSKAGSTMAAAIRDGTFSIEELTEAIAENGETIAGCAEDTYDFSERFQIFKQQMQVALEPLAMTLFDSINDLMPVVTDLISGIIPVIQDVSKTMAPLIKNLVAKLGPMLQKLVPPLTEIATALVSKLLPPLFDIIEAVLPVAIQLIELLMPIVEFIAESVLPVLVSIIGALLPPIMKLIEKILPVVIKLMEAVLPLVMKLIDSVLPIVITLLDAITPILDLVIALLSPILDLIVALLSPILDLIETALGPLIDAFSELISYALEPLMPLIDMVSSLFTGSLGNALSTIQPLVEAVTGVFGGLMDFIQNVFTGNWSGAWDNIKNIFSNVWEGIKNLGKGAINGLITAVESGINLLVKMINGLTGGLSKTWTWLGIPAIPEIPLVSLPRLATGGFTEGVSIAGEEGTEAVISFDPAYREENIELWQEAGKMLGTLEEFSLFGSTEAAVGAIVEMAEAEHAARTSLLAQASRLVEMDDFSLGGLTESTVIVYDFSGFHYDPQVTVNGKADRESIMEALEENEQEFFDWLTEWARRKEEGSYDGDGIS